MFKTYRTVAASGAGIPGLAMLQMAIKLTKEHAGLFGDTRRLDRLSLKWLRPVLLCVSVRTVKRDYKQRELPQCMWYSVISTIDGIEAGHLEQTPGAVT